PVLFARRIVREAHGLLRGRPVHRSVTGAGADPHRSWPRDAGRRCGYPGARRRRLSTVREEHRTLFEEIDPLESIRAQVALAVAASAALAVLIRLHIARAAPVLRRFRAFQRAVFPLAVPVLDIHFLDSAVEVLDLDGAVIIVVCDDLEESAALFLTIPITD